MTSAIHANGIMSPPPTEKAPSIASPRIVLAGKTGRILCVADIRGDYHELNRLIREHEATAVIHTGDFGFINADSLDRMGDKILRHLLQYSPLIPPATRAQLLSIPQSDGREALIDALNNSSIYFPLSQFPHLLSGAITFSVPVFTVWGLIEDVNVLEKFRTGEFEVQNLHVIDEASSKVLDVGGLKMRLYGLGGTAAPQKLFDTGDGHATIAGALGTMWTTAIQMGELIDTAQRTFDPTETRVFVSSAPISRNGLMCQLSIALKADLTISSGLHYRYPASFNDYAVTPDYELYCAKLVQARDTFMGMYNSVRDKIEALTEAQQTLLKKVMVAMEHLPQEDDRTWTDTWHWVLSDASCGHMLFSIADGRVTCETKSNGLNFAHRAAQTPQPPSASAVSTPATFSHAPRHSNISAQPAPGPAIQARPPVAAAQSIPARPPVVPTQRPPPPNSGFQNGVLNRQPTILPRPAAAAIPPPSLPNTVAANSTPSPAPIPPRPPVQVQASRQPRGPGGLAGQALAAAGAGPAKDRIDPKPAVDRPYADKGPADRPPVNRSALPGSLARPPPPPSGPKAATSTPPARPNGPASKEKPNGPASKAPTPAPSSTFNKPASAVKPPADKPKDFPEKKAEPVGGSANAKTVPNGDKPSSPSTPSVEETDKNDKDGGHSRNTSTSEPARVKKSLYLKGLPIPVTEDEIKKLFPSHSDKIVAIKIISDHFTKKQKDFAYVDFANEEDMQKALENHEKVIGETTINISVSDPPKVGAFREGFRGRGRGGLRGGRGGARGSFGGARKDGEGGGGGGGSGGGGGGGGGGGEKKSE